MPEVKLDGAVLSETATFVESATSPVSSCSAMEEASLTVGQPSPCAQLPPPKDFGSMPASMVGTMATAPLTSRSLDIREQPSSSSLMVASAVPPYLDGEKLSFACDVASSYINNTNPGYFGRLIGEDPLPLQTSAPSHCSETTQVGDVHSTMMSHGSITPWLNDSMASIGPLGALMEDTQVRRTDHLGDPLDVIAQAFQLPSPRSCSTTSSSSFDSFDTVVMECEALLKL